METSRSVSVQRMDDSFEHFRAEFTPAATQLKLFSGAQKSPAAVFTWAAPDATHASCTEPSARTPIRVSHAD